MKGATHKIVFLFLLIVAGCTSLYSQTFTARASRTTVAVGEEFQIDYSINANGSGFAAPSLSDFDVYSGPNESTSVEFINGNVSQSITMSFILAAKKEGTFTINGATIHAGGQTLTSNALTIKVVKGNPQAQQNSAQAQNMPNQPSAPAGGTLTGESNKNLFIKLIPSKSKVYQGEGLLLTIKIFTRLNLTNINNPTFPEYNGFFNEDVTGKNVQVTLTRETYNGQPYNVAVLKQTILFPEHPGNLKIDPAGIDCIVAERVKSNNIFDQFFGGGYKNVKYTIKSDPISINVLPLPDTKKEFSGGVGQLSVKGTLDKSSVKANDAINLNITVSGSGNLKLLDSLPVKFPPDFDHYDPKITDHITTTAAGVSGSRTFNYLLIPRHQGKYTIPAEEFTYFDPQKRSYNSLSIPEFNVDVAKGDNNNAVTMTTGSNKEDIKLLGQDIRYIHTGHVSAYPDGSFFLYSVGFYAGLCSPFLAFLLIVFARRKYIELNKDVTAVKQRGATRMAKKRLKTAFKYIATGNKESFYEEIHKALNNYLSDKFAIPVADLSKENITSKLNEKNVKPETLRSLMSALDNCEYARYAPATVTSNLNEVYESSINIITKLEDEIVA
jgi:hypothetical protein